MARWEYLSITAHRTEDKWRVHFVNGNAINGWEKGASLEDYLNTQGDDGWELVSEHYDSGTSSMKWAYGSLWVDVNWTTLKVDNETYKNINGYMEYLNKIGKEGWQIAAVVPVSSTSIGIHELNYHVMVIKYPIITPSIRLRLKRQKP